MSKSVVSKFMAMGGKQGPVQLDLSTASCGTMRPSGSYIGMLLELEGDRSTQLMVLSDVMETLGITPADITKYRKS